MEQRKFTQEEIEKIMESAEGISRAEISPFFYTRLQAKIDSRSSASAIGFWQVITKPAVSLVTLSLLLVLNIAVVSYYNKTAQQPVSESNSGMQEFAEEYNLGTSTVYNDKTDKE